MRLQSFLTALVLCSLVASGLAYNYEQYKDVWRSFLVIPSHMMTKEDLSALGLHDLALHSKAFEAQQLGKTFELYEDPENQLVIPEDGSFMFLFNSKSSISAAAQSPVNGEATRSNHVPLPFELPQFSYVADMFLMVPSSFLMAQNETQKLLSMPTSDAWVEKLGFNRKNIPISSSMIDGDKPIVTFVFQSGDDLNDFETSKNETHATKEKEKISDALLVKSTEVVKALIGSSEYFFDKLAQMSVESIGSDSLVLSVFCLVDETAQDQNYCLRMDEAGAQVSLLTSADEAQASKKKPNDSQFEKRHLGFMGKNEESDGADDEDDPDSFDFLNPYDWKYESKMILVRKLKKIMDMLGCPDDDDNDADTVRHNDEEDDENEFHQSNIFQSQLTSYNGLDCDDDDPDCDWTYMYRTDSDTDDLDYYSFDSFPPYRSYNPSLILNNLAKARQTIETQDIPEHRIPIVKKKTISLPALKKKLSKHEESSDRNAMSKRSNVVKPWLRYQLQPRSDQSDENEDCTEVTWHRIFAYSLFGGPTKFCTLEQLKQKKKD